MEHVEVMIILLAFDLLCFALNWVVVSFLRISSPFSYSSPSFFDIGLSISTQTNEVRTIHHFQYTAWPDHGLPVSTHAFLDLAHKVDDMNETDGPLVVHCR